MLRPSPNHGTQRLPNDDDDDDDDDEYSSITLMVKLMQHIIIILNTMTTITVASLTYFYIYDNIYQQGIMTLYCYSEILLY